MPTFESPNRKIRRLHYRISQCLRKDTYTRGCQVLLRKDTPAHSLLLHLHLLQQSHEARLAHWESSQEQRRLDIEYAQEAQSESN